MLVQTENTPEGIAAVMINSFAGKVVRVRVSKKAGARNMRRSIYWATNFKFSDKQEESLLSDAEDKEEESGDSIWSSISKFVQLKSVA